MFEYEVMHYGCVSEQGCFITRVFQGLSLFFLSSGFDVNSSLKFSFDVSLPGKKNSRKNNCTKKVLPYLCQLYTCVYQLGYNSVTIHYNCVCVQMCASVQIEVMHEESHSCESQEAERAENQEQHRWSEYTHSLDATCFNLSYMH